MTRQARKDHQGLRGAREEAFRPRPSPPISRSSRVSTRSTRTSPTSLPPRASTSARSMTSRLPRKCCTIPPMPMRRRCSRWTSPKTRPSFPSSRKTSSTCSSRATPTTTRTPSSRSAPPPVRRGGHLRRRLVQDVPALLRVARLEDYRARFQPQRGRWL